MFQRYRHNSVSVADAFELYFRFESMNVKLASKLKARARKFPVYASKTNWSAVSLSRKWNFWRSFPDPMEDLEQFIKQCLLHVANQEKRSS